ncbi:similar to Saccharomyces cerevisiae YNL167C SKO1 Basic leucine zipper transcription factor of the ATF/CREB family [Maudiozyma barnettii]|uniref:Similar to Saccharomyces cerevisiae YNL167C SKO1 Basic leucine zipper transcription factor of the ATF/CREB family n=1 Tax=Maudiozyma barnettii TaxID=61262 RepID=A0A8H2VEB0_9SACH|nr:Sko1p [Kazachstania barnettii]CAB4253900.1 similar to Saccharomyces cerevisiae YNL167C SKO1 Basic leucine zipper transcription factor of the ATF/CREB family [Kazachstania barnettii]CAD1781650.1 similar to Saccharomyces cerevisiae YNL167C SKO1 Basic leucine zipper transcription factor of the ATF/CREB family [Kazachstania barnettii]
MTIADSGSASSSNVTATSATASTANDPSKPVSSLNLEPNPFEQSFASTKKPFDLPIGNTNGLVSGSPSSLLNLANQPRTNNSNSSAPRGFQRSNNIPNIPLGSSSSTTLLFSGQRPVIHSPPMLTPGGSKRLPPLLSPNFNPQPSSQQSPDGGVGLISSLMNSNNNNNNSSSNSNSGTKLNSAGAPSFLSYLPRTGLTPNESSIRSGLTPGSLGASFNYPLLPALSSSGGNNNNNSRVNQPSTPGMSAIFNGVTSLSSKQVNSGNVTTIDSAGSSGASGSISPHPQFPSSNTLPMGVLKNEQQNNMATLRSNGKKTAEKATSIKKKRASTSRSSTTKSKKKTKTNNEKDTISGSTQVKIKRESLSEPSNETSKISTSSDSNNNSTIMTMGEDTEEQLSPEQEEQKRKEFLERNRVAASKFRKRKKEYIKKIEEDIHFYETEYNEMSKTLFKLLPPSTMADNSNSYILSLEDAIRKGDMNSALNLVSHVRQIISSTGVYQRNGTNPLADELQVVKDHKKQNSQRKNSSTSSHSSKSTTTTTTITATKRQSLPVSMTFHTTNAGPQHTHHDISTVVTTAGASSGALSPSSIPSYLTAIIPPGSVTSDPQEVTQDQHSQGNDETPKS